MTSSIIIPVYNRKELIAECLNSLLAQTVESFEIIVIDDGSTDGTKDILKTFSAQKGISVLYNDNNRGPSYARNRGIKKSKGEFIALIDSDCIAENYWLEKLIRPFYQDPNIMITTGKVSGKKPSTYWQLVNKNETFIQAHSGYVQQAVGCNMALRRDFALRHAFDERITSAACEDLDLCFFCIKEKHKIFFTDMAQVIHLHRATFRSTLKQQFAYGYYNAYVRIKQQQFPYLNYGTFILLAAFLLIIPGRIFHQDILILISLSFMTIFLGLAMLLDIRPKTKAPREILLSYPGLLAKCLSNCWGNIFWLFHSSRKLK